MTDGETDFLDRSFKIGAVCAVVAGVLWVMGKIAGMSLLSHLGSVGLISVLMWQACEPFSDAAQWIGRRYRIPCSVRGATLDAIASSMPELFTGVFFVLYYDDFGATVATCAGSAVYNMILIPAICAIAISFVRRDRPVIRVAAPVLARDGLWFLLSEIVLLYCLFTGRVNWIAAMVFLCIYAMYVLHMSRDVLRHRSGEGAEDGQEDWLSTRDHVVLLGGLGRIRLTTPRAVGVLLAATVLVAGACYFLVESCEGIAGYLGVPTFFVAVIVAAAASSVPDTMISLGAALRGDDSGAVSNAFGSNTFDINICLAVPVLVFAALHGGQEVPWEDQHGVVWLGVLLWVLSALTLGLMWHRHRIGRGKAVILCLLYGVFVGYAIAGSITVVRGGP